MLLLGLSGCRADKPTMSSSIIRRSDTIASSAGKPESSSSKIRLVNLQQETVDTTVENAAPPPPDSARPSYDIPASVVTIPGQEPTQEAENPPGAILTLEELLCSVVLCYPEIDAAMAEIEAAEGKIISASGRFDTVLKGNSISQPLSFYKNYRNGIGIAKPLLNGGEVYSNYRIGRGDIEPWYGERVTDKGGEFRTGFSLPLLKDRAFDARRAAIASARANRDQVSANVNSRLLQLQRMATQAYWDWVASGQVVQIQRRQLELANQRVEQINLRVEKGDLAKIAQIDNERFIAKRKNTLIKARRLLQKAAIKLSLYYRDANCTPLIAESQQLPGEIPLATGIADSELDADIAQAVIVRPELVELQAARREACVDLTYAQNLQLPKLDMQGFASKDVGEQASSLGDKTPFELQVGVFAEVPLQRREALGKIQTAQAKIAQIDAKSQFFADKIRAELQDAASAVNAAIDQIEQSRLNVELTQRSLTLGRAAFEAGDIDLIALNIYETSVAEAELELLDAYFDYFFYQAVYETAKASSAGMPLTN